MKKLIWLSVAGIMFLHPAQAQAPTPSPAEVSLKVTLTEADVIWKALRKLPVEDVEALMTKLRQQVATQMQPPIEDKKEPAK